MWLILAFASAALLGCYDSFKKKALKENAVKKISRLLLDSDQIHFIIGTKLNEAHQDPSIPFDIGIRRTIVNRIIKALDENFMKLTTIEYL